MSTDTIIVASRDRVAKCVTLAVWTSFIATAAIICLSPPSALAQTASRRATSLQELVNDTAVQLQLAYRHDAAEHRRRYNELASAISAWRAAERSAANNHLLAEWLRAAIRSSMPGSRDPLPPVPKFEPPAVTENVENATAFESRPTDEAVPIQVEATRLEQAPASQRDAARPEPMMRDAIPSDAPTLDITETEALPSAEIESVTTQPNTIEAEMLEPEPIELDTMDKATGDPFVDDPL